MANRLARETSPYLLQHAENPVDWRPWGEEAFELARAEDRPVLLSIGYSACHWCHVMERESFEDPETAAYMNEHFVAIKVDREERPDVDAIYMEAVQSLTGHGGWPLTSFLDPDGVPFHGGTYFPDEPRGGMPSFRMVMEAVIDAWTRKREEIRDRAPRIREHLGAIGRAAAAEQGPSREQLDDAIGRLEAEFDPVNGGLGDAPKFPPASALELLLGNGKSEQVERTLDAMAFGGIRDQLGGGFARYSLDAHWLVPHFEKMLYDNALLGRAYLHGWLELGHERYRDVAVETLEWALREMRGPEGGFYAALDADSEGVEGRYYVWTPDEITAALEARGLVELASPVLAHYGVSERGNFEGANILHLPGGAADPPERLAEARGALLAARAERIRPGLDDKRICSWNALMIAALADAGASLGEPHMLDAAHGCAEFVLAELRDADGRLLRTWKDGRATLPAYLEDHAHLLEALLTLYEASFEVRWYEAAREVAESMIERFADPEGGGFFTTAGDHAGLIARRKDADDHPIPSGSSAAALGLLRLAALSGEARFELHGVSVLRTFGGVAVRHPQAFGHMLRALDFQLGPTRELALSWLPGAGRPAALEAVARRRFRPRLVVAGAAQGTEMPELLAGRVALEGRPAAYLCESFACRRPVTDALELEELLTE